MKNLFLTLGLAFTLVSSAETFWPPAGSGMQAPGTQAPTAQGASSDAAASQAAPVVAEIKVEPRKRRFAFGPQIGVATFTSDLKGFEMKPAFSLGLRTSFDIVHDFLAIGYMLHADFIHFSTYKDSSFLGDLDVSSLNHSLFLEFKPVAGLYFGPYLGLSQKAYSLSEGGIFSQEGKSGTDEFLLTGGFIGYFFQPGRRFYLGPRVDVFYFSALSGNFLNSHGGFNIQFATKWTF